VETFILVWNALLDASGLSFSCLFRLIRNHSYLEERNSLLVLNDGFLLVARRPRMVLVGNAWILCCPPICWDLLSRAMKWMPLAVGRTTNQVYNMLGPGWWRSEAE
jgi:hypothetical protein